MSSPAPITAEELIVRWHIGGATPTLRLLALRRRCTLYRLKAMAGTRGLTALYRPADVDRAEARSVGEVRG